MVSVKYYKTDIGAKQNFAAKEKNSAGTLTAIDLTGKTVTFVFKDYDGNTATISGGDVVVTDADDGEGYFTITSAITTDEKEWDMQMKIVEGATYIEHSDPIVVIIGAIAE